MISFKIIQTDDSEILNHSYTFHHNLIYIGHSQGHFYIKDPAVINNHIMLEVIEDELYVHPHSKVEFYLIDGKRATSIKKIRPEQIITIGKTQIQILSFKKSIVQLRKEILDLKLKNIINTQDPRLSVIEKLSEMMKR